ncbi:MAG: LysE family translocator [Proteobacteria bacterium]|nr:LysE family translocator [Pseudomonadota bacterium]
MIDLATYLTFVLASFAIVIVPGPTVTVIIANSLRHGARAGLLNVAGTQLGLMMMLAVLAFGFQLVVEQLAGAFEIIRLIGAAYLIWLGIKLLRAGGFQIDETTGPAPLRRTGSFFWQGFLVICSNPKALLLFGAFIPQFLTAGGASEADTLMQVLLLGVTFMIVGAVFDGAYAVVAGRAGQWLTRRRIVALERISGAILVAGGIWLAFSRRA